MVIYPSSSNSQFNICSSNVCIYIETDLDLPIAFINLKIEAFLR